MDSTYVAAVPALVGSVIGGLTSFATTWLSQQGQFKAQQGAHDLARREELYKDFIEEASSLYADAWEHDKADTAKLVNLYALVSRMRARSSPGIAESADKVVRLIIETYLEPNRTFRSPRADPVRAWVHNSFGVCVESRPWGLGPRYPRGTCPARPSRSVATPRSSEETYR